MRETTSVAALHPTVQLQSNPSAVPQNKAEAFIKAAGGEKIVITVKFNLWLWLDLVMENSSSSFFVAARSGAPI